MNRTERRAAERKALKLARKACFPTTQTQPSTAEAISPSLSGIPEPSPPLPSLADITKGPSEAKLAANRANAQHSTGPVTPAGRAISSQNRTTHGLARHNGSFLLLPSEDPNGYRALKTALMEEHQPATETEAILINTMAESHWLANRAQTLQASCHNPLSGEIVDTQKFSLYLRYQTTYTRAFQQAFNQLLKLRAERRKTQIGFEAQKRITEEMNIKAEQHAMKKQKHYWEVLKKDGEACLRIIQNTVHISKATAEDPWVRSEIPWRTGQTRPPAPVLRSRRSGLM